MIVRTTYLELPADAPIERSNRRHPDYQLHQAIAPRPEFTRFLYTAVGYQWNWTRRLSWSYAEWEQYLSDDRIETWVVYVTGSIAGYFELAVEDDVEIRQFGMLKYFIGCGIGGSLLYDAVNRGRALGSGRVWLHTCTDDHPHAIGNYRARGFRVFKEDVESENRPVEAEPWPCLLYTSDAADE